MWQHWKFITLITLTTLSSAAQPPMKSVELLHSNYHRAKFLKSVFQWNEQVQEYEDSVMAAAGWGSDEHQAAIDSLNAVDSMLIAGIDQYLHHYGFPTKDDFDEPMRITPLVILNRSTNVELRSKHFPKLYKAYQKGDLEQRRLLGFLEESYKNAYGKNFQSYARGEERLDVLMKELDLKTGKLW